MFKDMTETAASLFGMTVLEGKRESSCAAFLVNTLRPRFQNHLSWSRRELPSAWTGDLPCRKRGSAMGLCVRRRKADFGGNSHTVSTSECLESKRNEFMLLYFSERYFAMPCLYSEQRAISAAWEHVSPSSGASQAKFPAHPGRPSHHPAPSICSFLKGLVKGSWKEHQSEHS